MTEQELIEREELLEDILDALEDGDIEEVEDLADDAIEQFPEEAFGYFYLGEALFFQNEYEEAVEQYQKAIELATDNPDYKARLGLMYSKLARLDEAKQIYRTILEYHDTHVPSLVALGVLELNAYEANTALELLHRALEVDPDYVDGYRIRALIHQKLDLYAEALEDLESALISLPTDSELWLQKISLHDLLQQHDEAKEAYVTWVNLDLESTDRLAAFGEYLMNKEAFAEAEEQYTQAIEKEIFGDLAAVYSYLNRGWARLRQDKLEEAAADFRKVINLDATIGAAYMGMAEAKSRQSDFDAAVTFIDLGINVAVDDLWMLYDKKGEIHILSKDWDLAQAAYENNIAMPDDLSKSEGYFGLGNMYHQKGDLQNAYLAWKEADKYFHTYANEYIEQYCQDILAAEIEANAAALIIDMQGDFAANRASKILNPLLHQLWKVDMKTTTAQNPMFKEIPPEMEKQILGLMSNICVGLEAEGMFVLNPGQSGVRLVYKIKEESDKNVSVAGIPLNGTEERTFVLTPKGSHLVLNGFGEEGADIDLYMEAATTKQLSKATQEALFKAKQGGKLDFMGESFKSLV